MSSSGDVQIQGTVHSVDQGVLSLVIKCGVIIFGVLAMTLLYLFVQFKGLSNPSAMDQAQISRNIASGKGFTTDFIRPAALGMVMKRMGGAPGPVDLSRFPDFNQAPLSPLINAIPLSLVKGSWKMTPTDLTYTGDRVFAIIAVLFFLGSLVVWYFVFSRLFDPRLAAIACGCVLVTDLMWQFSMTGLPQMLVLFLFSLSCLTTLNAMTAKEEEKLVPMLSWAAGTGFIMGLMTLAHGLSVWMFLGWIIFAGIYFRPRGLVVAAALAAFLLVVAPWLVRNYQVSGNPGGLAIYEAFFEGKPEEGFQRNLVVNVRDSGVSFQSKVRIHVLEQVQNIFGLLGLNLAAGAFFLALLHPFRSEQASAFRWCILSMWIGAVLGMCLFRGATALSENQFHVVFIPVFAVFGLAFLFVLWNRLEFGVGIMRTVFVVAIIFLCAIPMLLTLFAGRQSPIQWPPYVPPFIGILGDWVEKDEVICSDMPWATAWYAQRTSLLLPASMRLFNRIHDYEETKQPIVALYLTPLSGDQKLYTDIYKGPGADWAPLITRPPRVEGFPFTAFTALPIDGECIIFADRDRWSKPRKSE